jgi:drug/metabolite transporter (DMT)-like permease
VTPTTRAQPFTGTDATLLVMTTIWAVNFSVAKFAVTEIGPRAFTGLRVALAAIVLLAISAVVRAPLPSRRDVLTLLVIGVVGHAVYQVLFIEGLARTRAGNAALIVAATPAFIAMVSRWRGIETLRRRAFAGIGLSIVGVAAVVLGSATSRLGAASLFGTLLIFGATLCWTTFTIGLQPFAAGIHPLTLATTTIVGGVVPLLIFSGPALLEVDWPAVSGAAWLALLYASVLSMVVAYLFWFRGVRVIGPTRTAVYANVQPLIALLVAWATLGEVPTAWQAMGAATIISGVLIARS